MSVIAAKLAGLKERRWGRKLVHKEWPGSVPPQPSGRRRRPTRSGGKRLFIPTTPPAGESNFFAPGYAKTSPFTSIMAWR